jgi:hypothetical protein
MTTLCVTIGLALCGASPPVIFVLALASMWAEGEFYFFSNKTLQT